jgi:hypothetical protein
MPLYFFDIDDGSTIIDDYGANLSDLEAAHVEALRLSGALVRDDPQRRPVPPQLSPLG